MDVFSKQYADYLLTLNCKSDQLNTESDAKIFATLTKSYANKLHEYANKKYDECIDSAVNLTEEEIEDAISISKKVYGDKIILIVGSFYVYKTVCEVLGLEGMN